MPGTASLRGSYWKVKIEIDALPVLHCRTHGDRRFPTGNFGNDLIEAVWRILQPATQTPLWFMSPRCYRDGTRLPDRAAEPRWFEGTLTLKGTSGCHARVCAPAVRCPSCGIEQLETSSDLDSAVADALLDALGTAGVRR